MVNDGPARVLILIRGFNPGGAERQLLAFLENIDPQALAVTVACFYEGVWDEQVAARARARIVKIGKRGRYDFVLFFLRMIKLVNAIRPHIIYGYGESALLLSLLIGRLTRTKVVWGIRNSVPIPPVDDKFLTIAARFARWLSCFLQGIIINSNAGARAYTAAGYPAKLMRIIPNGIDTHKFKRDAAKRIDLRRQWDIGDDVTLVGYVARHDPIKDHETFLQAASLLANRGKFKFICVGAGEESYTRKLKRLASSLKLDGHLIWAGYQQDAAAVYSALDVSILCSLSEGFPNTLCEGMACEIPCVATDVGDCREILGNLGNPVPVGDATQLAAEIERLSGRLSAAGVSARAMIGKLYSVEVMSRNTTNYFVKLAVQ